MSLQLRAAGWALRGLRAVDHARNPLDGLRARVAATPYPQAAPVPGRLRTHCEVTSTTVDGLPVHTLAPRTGATGDQLIYTHGGAYRSPLVGAHWRIVEGLVARTGATVTVPLYRLAPFASYRDAYPFLTRVHTEVARRGGRVMLAGDSAGAGLALGQALRLRDAGEPLPSRVLLISPWVDVTMTNPAIDAVVSRDPMLDRDRLAETGRWWADGDDPRTPLVSPLFADLAGLPPVMSVIGGRDLLLPDAQQLHAHLRRAGVEEELHEFPQAWHDFVGLPTAPESRAAYALMSAFLTA